MAETSKIALYQGVRREFESGSGYPIIVAETSQLDQSEGGRVHKRVLGGRTTDQLLYGKPLLYVDTYSRPNGEEVFAYARHSASFDKFMFLLDSFLTEELDQMKELVDREFQIVYTLNKIAYSVNLTPPFSTQLREMEGAQFIRISLPFGDLAAEFGDSRIDGENNFKLLKEGLLPKFTEAPLVGFDSTRSTLIVPFIARIHWAADEIPQKILRNLLADLASSPIPA